ncbi:SC24B protein, partial [Bucorvus abyssinicus]|nr:SC24B protein [Bucorvus abyssinicus]
VLSQKAFRTGTSRCLDDRIHAVCQLESQPRVRLVTMTPPNFYRTDKLTDESTIHVTDSCSPPPLQKWSAEELARKGAFLTDCASV